MPTFEEAVEFLDHIGKYGVHPGIENSQKLLAVLGHPEQGQKIIHVAGTNGKGSVCAFLADMLTAQGQRAGLFISPHLVDIRERIQLDRKMIGKEAFAACFAKVKEAAGHLSREGYAGITYFDYLLAVALCWYRQQGVDYIVLETGLGGRMDSTNAIENPVLTVITSISFDHTEILGDTLAKIAAEKAGIIKPQIPLIYCADEAEACDVIKRAAKSVGAPCIGVGRRHCKIHSGQDPDAGTTDSKSLSSRLSFTYHLPAAECAALWDNGNMLRGGKDSSGQRFVPAAPADDFFADEGNNDLQKRHVSFAKPYYADGIHEILTVNSTALYQAENAAIAYTAALWLWLRFARVPAYQAPAVPYAGAHAAQDGQHGFLPLPAPPDSLADVCATLRRALSRSVWEGRFEEILPDIYLDGAHNADGIRMLLASLRQVAADRPITLLFTAVKEKDTAQMILEICESGLFCRYLITTVGGARAIAPDDLKQRFLAHTDTPVTAYDSPEKAFFAGREQAKKSNGILLCAGSLYLVGIIKELLPSIS